MRLIRPTLARLLLAALACMAALAGVTAWAAEPPAKLPVESFFQNPVVSQVALSPDGRHLAMLVALKNGRVQLATTDTDTMAPKLVAGFSDVDIYSFHWVNSERLVFDTVNWQVAPGDNRYGQGLYAVNRDGTALRSLIERTRDFVSNVSSAVKARILPWNHAFYAIDHSHATDEVFVQVYDTNPPYAAVALLRLNTQTALTRPVNAPGHVQHWVVDPQGTPRIAMAVEKGIAKLHLLEPGGAWRKLAEFDMYGAGGFIPQTFGPDGTLYVTAARKRDKAAVYTYDLANNSLSPEPVFSLKDYDFRGSFVQGPQGVLGIRFVADAPSTYWFDKGMKAMQAAVDAALPATENQLFPAALASDGLAVVRAGSDTQPPRYFLYDAHSAKLTAIGSAHPQIDARLMAQKEMLRYKARDGLEIPAYLTLPRGADAKNLPMVVLVHGGPYVRGGSLVWGPDAQFLASRGYAVLEPEYRGSTGYGSRHFRAGWKQWGLKMQDDIADGTRWAIAKGIADPKRICIAGASYGGYATLMGLVNDPDLYQCGVDWVGVTDIGLLHSVTWSDASDEWKLYGMPRLVGDPDKDAAQLKATSPIEQAARITRPLLLAYGGADLRVPLIHGTKFRDAVKATNPNVEWITYPEEGHGWTLVKNRVDFWQRVEAFLDRNIGPSAAGKTATMQASK